MKQARAHKKQRKKIRRKERNKRKQKNEQKATQKRTLCFLWLFPSRFIRFLNPSFTCPVERILNLEAMKSCISGRSAMGMIAIDQWTKWTLPCATPGKSDPSVKTPAPLPVTPPLWGAELGRFHSTSGRDLGYLAISLRHTSTIRTYLKYFFRVETLRLWLRGRISLKDFRK